MQSAWCKKEKRQQQKTKHLLSHFSYKQACHNRRMWLYFFFLWPSDEFTVMCTSMRKIFQQMAGNGNFFFKSSSNQNVYYSTMVTQQWKQHIKKIPLKCVRCNRWHGMSVMVSKHSHTWLWYQSDSNDTFKVLRQYKWKNILSHPIVHSLEIVFFLKHETTLRIVSCTAFVYLTMSFIIFICESNAYRSKFKRINGLHCSWLWYMWWENMI